MKIPPLKGRPYVACRGSEPLPVDASLYRWEFIGTGTMEECERLWESVTVPPLAPPCEVFLCEHELGNIVRNKQFPSRRGDHE